MGERNKKCLIALLKNLLAQLLTYTQAAYLAKKFLDEHPELTLDYRQFQNEEGEWKDPEVCPWGKIKSIRIATKPKQKE